MNKCIGIPNHEWKLFLDGGKVILVTEPCYQYCKAQKAIYDNMVFVESPGLEVNVDMATECPAYEVDDNGVPTGSPIPIAHNDNNYIEVHGEDCECVWWPVVTLRDN
jgi:hypothetical protein